MPELQNGSKGDSNPGSRLRVRHPTALRILSIHIFNLSHLNGHDPCRCITFVKFCTGVVFSSRFTIQ